MMGQFGMPLLSTQKMPEPIVLIFSLIKMYVYLIKAVSQVILLNVPQFAFVQCLMVRFKLCKSVRTATEEMLYPL